MGLFKQKNDDSIKKSRILYISGLPNNYSSKSLIYMIVNEESGNLQFKKSLKEDECVNLSIFKIKSFDTITEEKIKEASGVGRAITGGLLFGPAGAVVGAVTAKDKKKKEYFECITYVSNDTEKTIIFKNADSNCLKFNNYLRSLINKNTTEVSTIVDL